MITQIYEVNDPETARLVEEAGVNNIGVLVGFGEFPRESSVENAKKVFDAITRAKKVALVLSNDLEKIAEIVSELHPDILHLAALPEKLLPGDVKTLKQKFPEVLIMRSIPVTGKESIILAWQYDGIADLLLLDSHKTDDVQVGATGFIHDWSVSEEIVSSVHIPVILAGGLGPENVAEAIEKVRPYGVDSKTKTDIPGTWKKDIEKVRQFVEAARTKR